MRLSTAIKHFETQLQADGKSVHTRGGYLTDLKKLNIWLRTDPDVASIPTAKLAQYLVMGPNRGPAVSLNRTKTALRMSFKFLTDAGHLDTDPARLIRSARTEPKTPQYLSDVEVRKLLTAIPPNEGPVARRDRAMLTLLLQTDIRLGGLVGLNVRDVRFGEQTLRVNGKGGTERSV